MIDYRRILVAYMRTVAQEEGVTFCRDVYRNADELRLDAEELRGLREVEDEVAKLERAYLVGGG